MFNMLVAVVDSSVRDLIALTFARMAKDVLTNRTQPPNGAARGDRLVHVNRFITRVISVMGWLWPVYPYPVQT